MRLIVLPPDGGGIYQGALVIEPQAGWITYWKEPGDAGIPPTVTPHEGSAFSVEEIAFPVPKLLDKSGLRDIGYDATVLLPVTLKGPADGGEHAIDIQAFIGVCQNICIPFQADLSLSIDTAAPANPVEAALVARARTTLPEAPSETFRIVAHTMHDDHKQLDLTLELPEGVTDPQIFVTGPSGHVFMDHDVLKRENGRMEVAVKIGKLPKNYSISGQEWGVLILGNDRAMESALAFE